MPRQTLSPDIISAAIEGFEGQKRRIDQQISELRQMLDGRAPKAMSYSETPTVAPKRKRRMSAAGRKAISEASKKRWAAFHSTKQAAKKAALPTAASAKKGAKQGGRKAAVKKASVVVNKARSKAAAKAPAKAAKNAGASTPAPAAAPTTTE